MNHFYNPKFKTAIHVHDQHFACKTSPSSCPLLSHTCLRRPPNLIKNSLNLIVLGILTPTSQTTSQSWQVMFLQCFTYVVEITGVITFNIRFIYVYRRKNVWRTYHLAYHVNFIMMCFFIFVICRPYIFYFIR
jgi:hypothetical protein